MELKSLCSPAIFAEFIGTYLLVFTVGCNVITGTAAWSVTSIACVLMVSIFAMGKVSGGHFNPAVSFAIRLSGQSDFTSAKMGQYMLAQFIGGLLAAVTYALVFWDVFNLAPAEGFNWFHAGIAELLYTFLLVFCVLNTACGVKASESNEYPAMAIAFSVIAGGYGAGHISGGCFNPAVALAIDLSSWNAGFFYSLLYIVFELAGAALAVVAYKEMENARKQPADARKVRFFAEFLGTFFLVLTVGLNVIGGSKAPVWSIAASLMCVIYCMGNVSGGHFNPAVTLAVSVAKVPDWKRHDGIWYMTAQTAGGLLGALVYSVLERGQVFPLAPGAGHAWSSAYFGEFAFTLMLCYVVLGVACVKHEAYSWPKESFFAFAIASCVTAGGYAIGSLSGGSLNPAVSISIALSSIGRGHGIFHMFTYVLFELLAGVCAGLLFRFTHSAFIQKES